MTERVYETDARFMRQALRRARKGLGRTSPNPAVGAVIVRGGQVIASGYHRKAGLPHAEIEALSKLGGKSPGDTMYVTLEPCNHFGRTPPCTQAILESGIRRVVVGMMDPNPEVSGGGCEFLKKKGVLVTAGVLEKECCVMNEAFLKFVTSKRPFVRVKSAMTLDGWTATSTGHSKWITNEYSRQFVHGLRNRADAVMVGVGTVVADDPRLTTRVRRGKGRDPMRIVLDTHLRTPRNARIMHHGSSSDTVLVVGPDVKSGDLKTLEKRGVSTLICPTRFGRIDLRALMGILGSMSVMDLLVEGGATLIGSMIQERLVDKFYIFKAPKILGGDDGVPMAAGPGSKVMEKCVTLKETRVRRFEEDILIEGYPDYGC